ncbi:hypothetical protein GIB67_007445 [Kingdonia uniflora]|uniref:Uncharacterized protein n=1 Tax=Kingdonia uniflora TaxID=39325 RepID=A0A7J7P2U1_9MAGN|nr:hypothetical protein GIB67_007445 [Kingdonia uniflora]
MSDMKLNGVAKQKERHIVTWTQQEDDILRERIKINGTENWAIIASQFEDKSTRQCRRRWYTYLNADFKRGGWSPEEDKLLCEAQKRYGNRWTEIAKVVSGRTDNAVKNRFTTLLKKEAKREALSKENINLGNSLNNKRDLAAKGSSESLPLLKKMRTDSIENCNLEAQLVGEFGNGESRQLRTPFTNLTPFSHNIGGLLAQQHVSSIITAFNDGTPSSRTLFSTELQDYLNRTNCSQLGRHENSQTNLTPQDFKGMEDNFRNTNMENQLCWRQPELYESPASSVYSTGSTQQSHTAGEKIEETQAEVCSLYQDIGNWAQPNLIPLENCGGVCESESTGKCVMDLQTHSIHTEVECVTDNWAHENFVALNNCRGICEKGSTSNCLANIQTHSIHTEIEMSGGDGCANGFCIGSSVLQVSSVPSSNELEGNGYDSGLRYTEFSSPPHVTPIFRAMADAIPTPQFSESVSFMELAF